MKIQTVLIDGYKNLSNVQIKLGPITLLVAENNFGKSNVLSGIGFGLSFIKETVNNKKAMMCDPDLIPLNVYLMGRNYRFEIKALSEVDGQKYQVQYGYEFSWKRSEEDEPKIVSEYLKVKLDKKERRYTHLIKRDAKGTYYKSSETEECDSKIEIEKTELAVNKLRELDGLDYAEIFNQLNNMNLYLEDNLDSRDFYRPNPLVYKNDSDLPVEAENLPRIVYQLKKEHPGQYILLQEVIKVLFPNVVRFTVEQHSINIEEYSKLPEDADVELTNHFYALYVMDKNIIRPINFTLMSDGFKRVFMILTKIIIASINKCSLIAIETPECCVHPNMIAACLVMINGLRDGCKVIVTTHSPKVANLISPSSIYIGVKRQSKVAEFCTFTKEGGKALFKDALNINIKHGDLLFSLLNDPNGNLDEYLIEKKK